ncbi:MAG: NUDIX domain-containing protein [Acidobacteria bacterium]|nr:NUDIX domain-containing protein [Acidobacteriota bacterium]
MKPLVHKVGLLLVDEGLVLLCRRKRTPTPLILPGGKIEPGETEIQCLRREIREELGGVALKNPIKVGRYHSQTPGPASKPLRIDLYSAILASRPKPTAEIAELIWFGPAHDQALLPPSLRDLIFPDLKARGYLPWP